jgi:hypothetical protein
VTGWQRVGTGTYLRRIKAARRVRRCDGCGRRLPAGGPYVEHRAAMWSEFTDGAYSIATCGEKTSDCPEGAG